MLDIGALLNNRYKILSVIAQGGMGAIYKAVDESLSIEVAVKENFFTNEEFSRQFHREAKLLAGLHHPNLPRVTDHFTIADQGQYLVMDYIDGSDLRKLLEDNGAFSEEEAIRIGVAICDALNYLHHRNPPVIHRDIKPGNIKITPNGQIFLVDFGLAKVAQTGQATTIGAQALTPGYAPPEQYGHGTEARSDIYALGATLHAILTGSIPEDGLSRAMGTIQLTPIHQRNPKISIRTEQVINKAMAVSVNERYADAEEFKQALLGANTAVRRKYDNQDKSGDPGKQPTVISNQVDPRSQATQVLHPTSEPTIRQGSINPPPSSSVAQPHNDSPHKKSHRALFLLGGIIGLVALGIIIVIATQWDRVPLVEGFEKTETQRATTPLSTQPLLPTNTMTLAPSATTALTATDSPTATQTILPTETTIPTPAGTPFGGGNGQISFVSDRSGKPQIMLMNADGSNVQQVTNMSDGACQPAWSPDGERLLFISPCAGKQKDIYLKASLYTINVDGTNLTPLASRPGGDFDPAWSPLGDQIVFTRMDGQRTHLYLYHLDDNSTTQLSPLPAYDQQPAWSPDGKQIAFRTGRNGQPQIWIMNADGSKATSFSALNDGYVGTPVWSPDGQTILFLKGLDNQPWIMSKRLDDRVHEYPIADNVRPVVDVDFSSDGNWLVFEHWGDDLNHDIYIMTSNGTNLTRLTDYSGMDYQPTWRPGH